MGVEGQKPDPNEEQEKKAYLGKVSVYGAGIAGLTAAHELAVRGFQVKVYECASAFNEVGIKEMAIGGLARTQYRLVDDDPASDVDSRFPGNASPLPQVLSYTLKAKATQAKLPDDVRAELDVFVKNLLPQWPVGLLHVHVTPSTGDQALAGDIAAAVRDYLRAQIDPATFDPEDIRAPKAKPEPVHSVIGGASTGKAGTTASGPDNELRQDPAPTAALPPQ